MRWHGWGELHRVNNGPQPRTLPPIPRRRPPTTARIRGSSFLSPGYSGLFRELLLAGLNLPAARLLELVVVALGRAGAGLDIEIVPREANAEGPCWRWLRQCGGARSGGSHHAHEVAAGHRGWLTHGIVVFRLAGSGQHRKRWDRGSGRHCLALVLAVCHDGPHPRQEPQGSIKPGWQLEWPGRGSSGDCSLRQTALLTQLLHSRSIRWLKAMCWGRGPCHARESRGCGGNPCGHGCGMHSSKADNIGLCQGPHSGSQSHNQDTS
mmetsp:Transcript_58912/g.97702  ORF Transcript_58912/g.97702 Transcript_58912/m.97702 type:complete len:265 (-) Transcript_58912:94-888(-)